MPVPGPEIEEAGRGGTQTEVRRAEEGEDLVFGVAVFEPDGADIRLVVRVVGDLGCVQIIPAAADELIKFMTLNEKRYM